MSHLRPSPSADAAGCAVVIGGSSGSVGALLQLLPQLPADFPAAVLVVVHQPPDIESLLPQVLGAACALPIREPDDKEPICAGVVYCAPPDYHLLVERTFVLSLSADTAVNFSRPSIDVLFESAADAYGPALAGVVLTGANEDGARGLGAVCAAGGLGIVQQLSTAAVPTMPAAALERCEGARELPLAAIGDLLRTFVARPHPP